MPKELIRKRMQIFPLLTQGLCYYRLYGDDTIVISEWLLHFLCSQVNHLPVVPYEVLEPFAGEDGTAAPGAALGLQHTVSCSSEMRLQSLHFNAMAAVRQVDQSEKARMISWPTII